MAFAIPKPSAACSREASRKDNQPSHNQCLGFCAFVVHQKNPSGFHCRVSLAVFGLNWVHMKGTLTILKKGTHLLLTRFHPLASNSQPTANRLTPADPRREAHSPRWRDVASRRPRKALRRRGGWWQGQRCPGLTWHRRRYLGKGNSRKAKENPWPGHQKAKKNLLFCNLRGKP